MRLLLAEDEEELSDALVEILKHNNYSVDAVYDGEEAYDYIMTDVYDGVILDIMMPKRDGISVLKQIRSEGITVPVLLLTAKSEIDDRVVGLDAGADDYLTKPFAMKELLARVRSITRRASDAVSSELKVKETSLDTLSYIVSAPGGQVRLANKEFQLLEMLMAKPGQIISVDQFMDKIWGFDSEAEQNTVWVYISNVRKKLTKINADITIKAHRGVGYSMEVLDD